MEKIPLVIHGFPFSNVLEKKSVSVLNITPTIKKFIASLKSTAAEHKAISLSAIQLGQPFRLFIASKQNFLKKKWFIEQPNLNQYEVFLNPRIKKLSSVIINYNYRNKKGIILEGGSFNFNNYLNNHNTSQDNLLVHPDYMKNKTKIYYNFCLFINIKILFATETNSIFS